MLIADVMVFVDARRQDSPAHTPTRAWLESALNGGEPFGVSDFVLSAFIRLVTNHRVFTDATKPDAAIEFCEVIRSAPASVRIEPGPRHWDIFSDLVRTVPARANVVPDAYLAALALENRATFVTRDRGFARFPGLRLLDPLTG